MRNSTNRSRWFLYGLLLLICCLYWCLDSAWSFKSYDRNLNALIYTVPGSFLDTFLLQVSPYQTVSRISVMVLLLLSGTLLIEFSSRKQKIAKALNESESRAQYIIDHANVGTCITQNQRLFLPNQKLLDIGGYTEEELAKLTLSDFIHPDDLEMTLHWYEEAMAGLSPETDTPFQVLTKKQESRWLLLSTTNIIWQGEPALFNILRDVTETLNREKKDQQAKKMEAIGLLAGGVAHDLNNILSGIVTYPEMMMYQLPDDSPLCSQLKVIQDSGARASAIIADLLTVARGVASNRKTSNLNDLVKRFLKTPEYKNLANSHPEIRVTQSLHEEGVYIFCSDIHIQKSIMNLLFNAFEALEQNNGAIILSTQCRNLTETECRTLNLKEGSYGILSIADTGPGISARQKEHIFEPFYTKKKMGRSGTGLGLTVVWNTVVEHEGAIDIQTSEEGTTFSLYLPAAHPPQNLSDSGKNTDEEVRKGSAETVLLVDDDPQQREIGSQFLTFLGYTPKSVASGEDAVKYLQNETVDLVVLDMVMDPGINGRETYEQILAIHPGQKAIIVSGYSEHHEITRTIELGAGRLLKKPYTVKNLATAVQSELSTR